MRATRTLSVGRERIDSFVFPAAPGVALEMRNLLRECLKRGADEGVGAAPTQPEASADHGGRGADPQAMMPSSPPGALGDLCGELHHCPRRSRLLRASVTCGDSGKSSRTVL